MSSSSLESCPQVARPVIDNHRDFVPLRGPRGQGFDVNAQIQLNILCDKCKALSEQLQSFEMDESCYCLETVRHYQNCDLLQNSYKRGCHLCSFLWRSLFTFGPIPTDIESYDLTKWFMTLEINYFSDSDSDNNTLFLSLDLPNYPDDSSCSLPFDESNSVHLSSIRYRGPFAISSSTISTKGATSRSFYQKCLEICDSTHTKCRVKRVGQLPTRLLHIAPSSGGTDDTPSIRLVLTGPEFSKDTKFAALSYCWGEGHGLRLEESNYQSLMEHIPFDELPATIQDSILVTIELGIQYLWVDALCIIQNQDSNEDWSYEAGKMCDIYQGCSIAIAASGASNSTEGLFAVRDPLQQAECVFGTSFITDTKKPDQPYWALETRGWALQEEILPVRSIRFGSYVEWNCRELLVNEFGQDRNYPDRALNNSRNFFSKIVDSPTVDPIDEEEIYNLWQRIIYRYSRTKLSYRSDKLAAIEGLRSAFQQRTGWAYAYGLWQPFITQELLWRRRNTAERNGLRPSWSWVSMDGEIWPKYNLFGTKLIDTAKFVGVSPSSSGRVNFDSLVKLELSGVLFQTCEPAVEGHPRFKHPPVPSWLQDWATIYETYDDRSRLWRKGDMALPLYLDSLGFLYGLIVIPFTGSGAFERVGYFFCLHNRCGRLGKKQMKRLARSLNRGEEEPFVRRNIQLV